MYDPTKGTHRSNDGALSTRAKPKFEWARFSAQGKVHRIDSVIIRWNFLGGTPQKPDVTFLAICGPQRHSVIPVTDPSYSLVCIMCDRVLIRRRIHARRDATDDISG